MNEFNLDEYLANPDSNGPGKRITLTFNKDVPAGTEVSFDVSQGDAFIPITAPTPPREKKE